MEPANILFIIAFIGIPIAFGVWALANRRALRQSKRPPESSTPDQSAQPTQPARRQRRQPPAQEAPSQPQGEQQPTRQMPAADAQPDPQPSQRTEPLPAAPQQDAQRTRQVPAAATQPTPVSEQQSERTWGWSGSSGSSGTTEEFPIISDPAPPNVPSRPDETMELPAVVVPDPVPDQPEKFAPIKRPSPTLSVVDRRPFRSPRYSGKSGGIVKRFPPTRATQFIRNRSMR
jgi:hypothetical protein